MKREAVSDFLIVNHKIHSTENTDIFDRIKGLSIYEVLRITDGVPLFAEEHIKRMKRSAGLAGVHIRKTEMEIIEEISILVKKNQCKDINVKLIWTLSEEKEFFLIYFIRPEYPNQDAYTRGIHTILFQGERKKPHIKIVCGSFREKITKARKKAGAYEALLVDERGYITEGSRSNIFFLKKGKIHTPPSGTVLLGVTREHVVGICNTLKMEISEAPFHIDEISEIEGAFITGTTVDVLPIGSVDNKKIPSASHSAVQKIAEHYDKEVKAYVARRKKRNSA
ncbi:aminotransferase class IV [Desulfonema magnum]|uniref:branched-chain-amino-acid transaminase n=1 Tax=Desulfonema magnum TaxID=45655 RepID=A0A975BR66_9BACT|nr:aminotransferase class IV [Desulfonema magnum]QTA90349.1 Aminotransferase, class IV [Desulfonema magnum]